MGCQQFAQPQRDFLIHGPAKNQHKCDLEQISGSGPYLLHMVDQSAGSGSDRYRTTAAAWLEGSPYEHIPVYIEAGVPND